VHSRHVARRWKRLCQLDEAELHTSLPSVFLHATPYDHASITIWWSVTAPYLELRTRRTSASFKFITSTLILFALWVADLQWCPSGSVNILIFIENEKCYSSVTLNFSVCKQLWPKIFQTQGLSHEEIVQWPCPMIDRLSGLLQKLSFLWAVLWASNIPKMHWGPGLCPGPQWESSRRSPDVLVGWGGGHQSQCPTPSEKRVAAENFGFCIHCHSNR